MEKIQAGDKVKHKTKILLNGGLAFEVLEVDGDKALCEYFDIDDEQTSKQETFDISELFVVSKVNGGFING